MIFSNKITLMNTFHATIIFIIGVQAMRDIDMDNYHQTLIFSIIFSSEHYLYLFQFLIYFIWINTYMSNNRYLIII